MKIVLILVVLLLLTGGAFYYHERKPGHGSMSGEMVSPDGSVPVSGGAPEGSLPGEQAQVSSKTAAPRETVVSAPPAAKAPTEDSISPNPPNGAVFAGTGHFQIYRQGNLTWRVNTDSGESCILFATDSEWRKPRVYEHGCASR